MAYARRIILLDVAYLLCLGVFIGIASTTLTGLTEWPATFLRIPVWAFWLSPALYIVCDFAEDTLIFSMLNWPSTIRSMAFTALTAFLIIQIASVTLGLAQVLLLCLLSYIWPAVSKS